MRRTLPTLFVVLLWLAVGACTSSIRWEGSIEDAQERSAADGKPVLLYFTYHG